jgi:hypothetical protein
MSESSSLDSLHAHLISDNSILTSTKAQELTSRIPVNIQRRKAIIPTPNRPHNSIESLTMNDEQASSVADLIGDKNPSDNNTDETLKSHSNNNNRYLESSCPSNLFEPYSSIIVSSANDNSDDRQRMPNIDKDFHEHERDNSHKTKITSSNFIEVPQKPNDPENQSQSDDNKIDDNFDSFIAQNFTRFSGEQPIIPWLEETEDKFIELNIGRNLRFEAVSLLVKGKAKRTYLKHRKEIRSFDDFYEFLLLNFDNSNTDTHDSKSNQPTASHLSNIPTSIQTRSTIKSTSTAMNIPEVTNLPRQPPAFCSTALVDIGATSILGETSATTSANVTNNLSVSMVDRTLNDLRKAIVANLIKDPKTFKGEKDDVKKWIEEIEHLLDVAHIPDSTRLDLISYSLRNDALEWFKNNRSTLTSWKIFVIEIKRAFTSSFHEEIAFKRLESYNQGENQSVRNFFNEILKLCREADSTMSESTKLKNLLNKTKPTIQFEVRKKKPTTTAEFLDYAKEAEELIQLSSITMESNLTQGGPPMQPQSVSPLLPVSCSPNNQSFNNRANNSSSNYSRNYNRDYHPSHNRNDYSNPKPSWNKSASRDTSQYHQNKPRHNQNNSQPSRDTLPTYPQNFNQKKQTPYPNNSSHNTYTSQPSANTINPPHQPQTTDPSPEIFSSILCPRCNQLGHEATACPSF